MATRTGVRLFSSMLGLPPASTLFPYTTLFRSALEHAVYDVNLLACKGPGGVPSTPALCRRGRSEEHTSELQSQSNLVCRLLLEKKTRRAPIHVGRSRSGCAPVRRRRRSRRRGS